MTIKEIEEITGMTRANIRFYEAEGLIEPKRNRENGYRIYSREDADALQKIRLLRSLDVSIDQIRGLQTQEASLVWTLEQHLEELSRRQDRLTRAQEVARQMIQRREAYDTMDVTMYLNALENGESLAKDVKPRLNLPWRRFWARGLDHAVCALVVEWALRPFPGWQHLGTLLALGLMLVGEPLLLRLFGTTLGKAVFGIRVTDPEGGRLSFGTALSRTWTVLWEGEALNILLICQYFQYKSLRAAENDETLPWEWDSELTIRDEKNWRYLLCFAALTAVWAARWAIGGNV